MSARDQADGLRRMLARRAPRRIGIVSSAPGAGRTTLAANLGAMLAQQGRAVVAIDGSSAAGNLCELLGLRARWELAHVLQGDRRIADVLLQGPHGMRVLPAARGLAMVGPDDARIAQLLAGADVIVTDLPGGVIPARGDSLVVIPAAADAVKDTYAWIKRQAASLSAARLGVVVCRGRGEREAATLNANLAAVARRHIGIPLVCMGVFGHDLHVTLAARAHRPVPDAFPRSRAAAQLRGIAARLEAPVAQPGIAVAAA